jgi:hypothetical protein
MKIWGLTEGEIRECVKLSGLAIWGDGFRPTPLAKEGKALHVRLCVDRLAPRTNGLLPFQKRGRSWGGKQGRRTPYVTWEGHREFMLVVFERFPEARIKSAIADYKGRDEFFDKHPQTKGLWN